jgi:hypothetical protein
MVLTGCYEDEAENFRNQSITTIPAEKTIFYDDIFELEVDFQPWFGISPHYTYASSDEWVATVDQYGRVYGSHIGTCTITATTTNTYLPSVQEGLTASCTVTVAPSSKLYAEPYFQIGATPATVKAFEKRELTFDGYNSQGYYVLQYRENNEYETYINYFFDGGGIFDGDGLFDTDVHVDKTEYSGKTVFSHLYERYDIKEVTFNGNITLLYMEDKQIYVEISITEDDIRTSYYRTNIR